MLLRALCVLSAKKSFKIKRKITVFIAKIGKTE